MGIPDEIEGVTPPPHIHPGSFIPVLQKCPELAGGGGGVYNIIFWTFKILLFLSNNCGMGLIKNNGR